MNGIRTGATAARLVALSVVFGFVATSGHWGRRLLAASLSTESAQAAQSAPSTISNYSVVGQFENKCPANSSSSPRFDKLKLVGHQTDPLPKYSINWVTDQTDPKGHSIEVTGLTKATLTRLRSSNWKLTDWQRLLRVQVEPKNGQTPQTLPVMLGTYRVEGNAIRFEPQYPLVPGVSYQASFWTAELPGNRSDRRVLTSVRILASTHTPATVVTHIYPTADVLPENLLKFYVHFSAPMSRGHIYDYIRLLKEDGKQVELPFLEIDEELWDGSLTRLTIFIDPGRIKRGVLPLEDVGPALEAGKRYTLVIDRTWHDGAGKPLKESFQKLFLVGAPDREPPDPAKWNIQLPAPGTQNPLVVLFPEPMDNAITQRVIHITDVSGKTVAGQIGLTDQERRWSFQPLGPWKRGQHQLVVQTTIEDLAGNNIGKPFDVDLFEGVQRRLTTSTVKLPLPIQ